jgi:hypothetical protein
MLTYQFKSSELRALSFQLWEELKDESENLPSGPEISDSFLYRESNGAGRLFNTSSPIHWFLKQVVRVLYARAKPHPERTFTRKITAALSVVMSSFL